MSFLVVKILHELAYANSPFSYTIKWCTSDLNPGYVKNVYFFYFLNTGTYKKEMQKAPVFTNAFFE